MPNCPETTPLKDKQFIVMSDASFTTAGYAIVIENDPNQQLQCKRQYYAPIAFRSKPLNQTKTKKSIYAKEIPPYFSQSLSLDNWCGEAFPQ